jgi:signal transduction histidine kinase
MFSIKEETYYAVVFACLFALLLILIIIITAVLYYNRRKKYMKEEANFHKELLQSQIETQEETFQQISQELHDNVGQLLSSTKLLLVITERQLDVIPDTLRIAEETLAKAIQDLRSFSKSLNKDWLDRFNIIENLRAETERINTARTINTSLICNLLSLPLKPESQIMLFRIVQEALQNSIKHAEAKQITIDIAQNENTIAVSVIDDGNGFDENSLPQKGVGLMNMKHRTHLLGGTIQWDTLPEKGTQVFISIPIQLIQS